MNKIKTFSDVTTKPKIIAVSFILLIIVGLLINNFLKFADEENRKFRERHKESTTKKVETSDDSLLTVDQIAALKNLINDVKNKVDENTKKITGQSEEVLNELQKQDDKYDQLTKQFQTSVNNITSDLQKNKDSLAHEKALIRKKTDELDDKIKNIKIKGKDKTIKNIKLPPLRSLTNKDDATSIKDDLQKLISKPIGPKKEVKKVEQRLDLFTPVAIRSNTPAPKKSMDSKTLNALRTNNKTISKEKSSNQKTSKKKKEKSDYTLTLGFTKAITLMGVDAPTSSKGKSNPYPVLLSVDGSIISANSSTQSINKCLILSTATGDLRTERANLRVSKLSCITSDGKRRIEANVHGWVIGEDGKPGIPGRVVTKSGQVIAKALAAGFLQGIANAFKKSPSFISSSGAVGGTVETADASFTEGFAEGSSDALGKLADLYIEMAKDIYPVIEVKPGRKVTILLKGGEGLNEVPFNKLFIGDTFESNIEGSKIKLQKIRKRIN